MVKFHVNDLGWLFVFISVCCECSFKYLKHVKFGIFDTEQNLDMKLFLIYFKSNRNGTDFQQLFLKQFDM